MIPQILLFIRLRCVIKFQSLFYVHCTSERVRTSNAWLQHFSTPLDDRGTTYLFVIGFFFKFCKLSPNAHEKLSKFLCCLSVSHLVSGYGNSPIGISTVVIRSFSCSFFSSFVLIFLCLPAILPFTESKTYISLPSPSL